MNIQTRGDTATFLLARKLASGHTIYLSNTDSQVYSHAPFDMAFESTLSEAHELYSNTVHNVQQHGRFFPGQETSVGLFKIVDGGVEQVASTELNSYNTVAFRSEQQFGSERLYGVSTEFVEPLAEFESDGLLDE